MFKQFVLSFFLLILVSMAVTTFVVAREPQVQNRTDDRVVVTCLRHAPRKISCDSPWDAFRASSPD